MSVARDDVQRALVVLDELRPVEIRQFRPDLADDEAFLRWANQPLLEGFQIASDAHGVVSIMSPTGWSSGPINARIIRQLDAWAETHGGYVTESSAMYHLQRVGRRVPDAAWISHGRLHDIPPRQRRAILPIAPEFVIEVRSETHDLGELMEKMNDWLSDGVLLGLLIDPRTHTAYVFAVDRAEPEVTSDVFTDQTVLPGFSLDLKALWSAYDDLFAE
ncbi:MAG: Uma2 family endonuclease [Chloroflexi bacterium]|nr:Uma2 family endonuclease [Chloroflexota bacterium]MBV9602918.1 Uma2 family endonuclease [Chloroflexota bacterium]